MSTPINAVVLGASGYVGAELLRLIAGHPQFSLAAAVSNSRAGDLIGELIAPLKYRYPGKAFVAIDAALDSVDDGSSLALFAAAPHGKSAAAVATVLGAAKRKSLVVHTVDVSADFRYAERDTFEAVYGVIHAAPDLLPAFDCAVPEHAARHDKPHMGHPGCFATAVLLAAVPAFAGDLIESDIYVTGITGSTGSGRSPGSGTHHPERHGNLYAYKPLSHRHVPEVEAMILAASGRVAAVNFIPHSGPFARGIYVTLQGRLKHSISSREALDVYRDCYAGSTFVHVDNANPRLKDVVASNYAHLGVTTNARTLAVHCAIDNLVKGAAGGAVQWMNRLWSLPEDAGLTDVSPGWT